MPLNRRTLLTSSAAAAATAVASPLLPEGITPGVSGRASAGPGKAPFGGRNVLIYFTDQENVLSNFPEGWVEQHLPNRLRLASHGLQFRNAFCNSCMCSPSRATLMTGYFPAQHGVKYTLEQDMPSPEYPQVELPTNLPNLASIALSAGYRPVFKGKWHLTKPLNPNDDYATVPDSNGNCLPTEGWAPDDVNRFGWTRWNPQDSGANQDVCQAAGPSEVTADVNNDERYMLEDGDPATGHEGVLAFLDSPEALDGPFLMFASMVNPHDVLAYPTNYEAFGYGDEWFEDTGVRLPETVHENLATKPSAQRKFVFLSSAIAPTTDQERVTYVNFYGNLLIKQDEYLGQILDKLEERNLLNNTVVIYTSDHGEVGTAHGGMIQKNFNFYEETLNIPMIYSNPELFPTPRESYAMVSHVDFLRTISSLIGGEEVPGQGVDYSQNVVDPHAPDSQGYIVFTYDDWQAGQASGPYIGGANRIVSYREKRWKLAKYWTPDDPNDVEWEMYDLKRDPNERRNLGWANAKRTKRQDRKFEKMKKRLAAIEKTRLKPLPSADWENTQTFGDHGKRNALNSPTGVFVTADLRSMYVSDGKNNRIAIFQRQSDMSTNWRQVGSFGRSGSGAKGMIFPSAVELTSDERTALISDTMNNRVTVWQRKNANTLDWQPLTTFGSKGSGEGEFKSPIGLRLLDDLTVWVADSGNSRLSIWQRSDANASDWTFVETLGSEGNLDNEFKLVNDVVFSSDKQTAMIADLGNNRICQWEYRNGAWGEVTWFGSTSRDTTCESCLSSPDAVGLTADDLTLYVSDTNNDRISVWTRPNASSQEWSVETTFGLPGDGEGELNLPDGLAITQDGNVLWVADRMNNRISVWIKRPS